MIDIKNWILALMVVLSLAAAVKLQKSATPVAPGGITPVIQQAQAPTETKNT